MATQCYFNGEFWQAVADTSPGESPETAPEKWTRVRIPKEWRPGLARLTYAYLLELDGQGDKSQAQEGAAVEELGNLIRREAQGEGWRMRPDVRTRRGH